ncbi:MAG: trifunctional transcriptional regulator/proline dehydrogenase/L-glutamate gamma-semialdehyde dehydrogenase, partial [Hydrogenophaga sp.]|nr:trifunctional transcriptional regulator/proline dehydrogenase/L-glutamate gamma-semialdehyde dehydrogenase [Hydrogenophaga sp.]
LRDQADAYRTRRITGLRLALPGPTGEDNRLRFTARGLIAGVSQTAADALHQVMAALISGNRLVLDNTQAAKVVHSALPASLQERVAVDAAWMERDVTAVLFDGADDDADALQVRLAARPGPILPLLRPVPGYDLTRLVHERTLSVNTAAAGGNASLMAMGA